MKRILFTLAALMTLGLSAPAHACKCAPDNGTLAQATINDPSISVAKVFVRGMNMRNGQSMLELRQTITGGLMARNFRAKFDNQTSCGIVPQNRKEQTLVIKFEKDGTYSVVNDCTHNAVMQYLKNNPGTGQ